MYDVLSQLSYLWERVSFLWGKLTLQTPCYYTRWNSISHYQEQCVQHKIGNLLAIPKDAIDDHKT